MLPVAKRYYDTQVVVICLLYFIRCFHCFFVIIIFRITVFGLVSAIYNFTFQSYKRLFTTQNIKWRVLILKRLSREGKRGITIWTFLFFFRFFLVRRKSFLKWQDCDSLYSLPGVYTTTSRIHAGVPWSTLAGLWLDNDVITWLTKRKMSAQL